MKIEKIKNLLVITNDENKTNSIDINTGTVLGKKGTKVKNLSPDIKQFLYHNVHCSDRHEFCDYINALFDFPNNIELLKFVDKMNALKLRVPRYNMGDVVRKLEQLNAIKFDKQLVTHLKEKNDSKVVYEVIQKFLKYSWLNEEQLEIFDSMNFERNGITLEKEELLKFFEWYKFLVAHEYIHTLTSINVSYTNAIRDYITKCKDLEKTDIYTKNFLLNYCRTMKDYEVNKNKMISKKIREWQENKQLEFTNEKFTIVVPMSYEEMKYESDQQNNCIARSYAEYVANKNTHIVFLRLNSNPNKSFISLEVSNDLEVRQALTKHNNRPTSEEMALVREYMKYLSTIKK